MDLQELEKQLKQGKQSPLYLIYGTETLRMEQALQLLENSVKGAEEGAELSVSKYDLEETPIGEVIEDAETYPFFGGTKCVIAHHASFLTSAKDTSKVEHHLDALLRYAESPAEHSIVVLTVKADKLDERRNIVKALRKHASICECMPLDDSAAFQWLIQRGQSHGLEWEPAAAKRLVETAGPSLQRLQQEAEKLIAYSGGSGKVTLEAVEQLVSRSLDDNVFALTEYVSKKQIDGALRLFHDLLQQKEEPIKLFMLLAKQFRLLLQVKELSVRGYGQQQIASTLGVHPYPVKLAMDVSKRYPPEELRRVLSSLADMDYQMKTGQIDKVLAIELFLLQLGQPS
jgi:DNA polymerase-3 subunit delta